jgi:hypothetical protein
LPCVAGHGNLEFLIEPNWKWDLGAAEVASPQTVLISEIPDSPERRPFGEVCHSEGAFGPRRAFLLAGGASIYPGSASPLPKGNRPRQLGVPVPPE